MLRLVAELVGHILATHLLELTSCSIGALLLILVVLAVFVESELLLSRVDALVEVVLVTSTISISVTQAKLGIECRLTLIVDLQWELSCRRSCSC